VKCADQVLGTVSCHQNVSESTGSQKVSYTQEDDWIK